VTRRPDARDRAGVPWSAPAADLCATRTSAITEAIKEQARSTTMLTYGMALRLDDEEWL
jgi:hypothetical protein